MGCNLNEGGEKSTILNAYTYSSTLTYDSNTYTRTACAFQTEFDPKFECVCGNCTMLCMWCQGTKRRRVVFLSCLLCFATTVRNQFSWQFRIELLQLIIVFVHFGWSERRTGCAVIHAFHSKLNWIEWTRYRDSAYVLFSHIFKLILVFIEFDMDEICTRKSWISKFQSLKIIALIWINHLNKFRLPFDFKDSVFSLVAYILQSQYFRLWPTILGIGSRMEVLRRQLSEIFYSRKNTPWRIFVWNP